MKFENRSKIIRNLWTNPGILFDHEMVERSYTDFLDRTLQRYDSNRAAQGVLRSQRNVFQFLSKGGLLNQPLIPEEFSASSSSNTTSEKANVPDSPGSSSADTPTKTDGRPVRACTLTTPKPKNFTPVVAAVSLKKAFIKKKSPPHGSSSSSSSASASLRGRVDRSSSNSSSSSSTTGGRESVAVYQQQLVIKQMQKSIEELLKRNEDSDKKRLIEIAQAEKRHSEEISALSGVAEEYKKLLLADTSSSSVSSSSNNKRKSRKSIIIYITI